MMTDYGLLRFRVVAERAEASLRETAAAASRLADAVRAMRARAIARRETRS